MMLQEFEQIAGYEVSYETYTNVIEPMYMALPEGITKTQFVGMLNKKAFALPTKKDLVKEMKKIANFLFENCGISSYHEEQEKLDEIAARYVKRFYGMERGDEDGFWYFSREYGLSETRQDCGCTFPEALEIYKGNILVEEIVLVK